MLYAGNMYHSFLTYNTVLLSIYSSGVAYYSTGSTIIAFVKFRCTFGRRKQYNQDKQYM